MSSGQAAMAWVGAGYLVSSAATFVMYGLDKSRARRGGHRISERTLHLMELLGGWPGGWIGQAYWRHKRRKFSYLLVFYAIVAVHVAAWGLWLWR